MQDSQTDTRRITKLFRAFLFERLNDEKGGKVSVLQVGANDGAMGDPLHRHLSSGDWTGVLIEPIPRYFEQLSARYAGREGLTLVNCAIADAPGTAEIHYLLEEHESAYPRWAQGLASFDRSHILRGIRPEHIGSVVVNTFPLAEIIEREGCNDTDILVVDVEGVERKVFDSFRFRPFEPTLIEVETRHLSAEDKAWLFDRLHKAGYALYDLINDTIAVRRNWLPPSYRHLLALAGLDQFRFDPRAAAESGAEAK
ncbi:FkbM family methyltransferase [Rhodobacteraceae bacterium NNCM2]|nr:FkbM family methyltransferase [Coraliihabitans acroporae]